ncbi:MAG: GTPase HflX [bacterium]
MGRQLYTSEPPEETVLLVGAQLGRATVWSVSDSVDELELLCQSAGARVVERIICKLPRPHPASFIGKGKATEIAELVKERGITTIVFDDDLSPAQGRNLEKIAAVKIIDRTQLILDIFAQHARTREGRMQIELAQLEYLLPRLKRMWTHLERQKGGIGLRGPGEKQIEMDRRRIVEQIGRYKKDLELLRRRRAEQRRGRRRHGWALISLVGYTNAGKSTLLNSLTGADVLVYDQLFATLDPTTRRLKLPNHQPALITDTVGFIRKLPHDLVDSFKATLEETIEADLLLHVIDASHPQVEQQIEAVHQVLHDLGVEETPVVPVFNKRDLPGAQNRVGRLEAKLGQGVAVSALHGEGLDHLRDVLADRLRNRGQKVQLRVPLHEGKLLAHIRSGGTILTEAYEDDFVVMTANIPAHLIGACVPFVQEPR